MEKINHIGGKNENVRNYYNINQNGLINNNKNNLINNPNNEINKKDLTRQMHISENDGVILKYRKFTNVKNNTWKIKIISKEDLKSYEFLINFIKDTLETNFQIAENLKINFHINKDDKIIISCMCKEDWEKHIVSNNNEKSIVSDRNTVKLEYELLEDINKNFNEYAKKCDLQNKIIENLFYCIKNDKNINKVIVETLKQQKQSENFDKYRNEIFKTKYTKILNDYTEKVYDALYNNIKNFQTLQDDLKKIDLDQELEFEKFEEFVEDDINDFQNGNNSKDFVKEDDEINYRSSFNFNNKDEMISKLLIETRNSLYNK